jgi:hypothetical protein
MTGGVHQDFLNNNGINENGRLEAEGRLRHHGFSKGMALYQTYFPPKKFNGEIPIYITFKCKASLLYYLL